jgi:hypothetical protein
LKLTLAKNEYPDQIINKEMDKFIKNRTNREQQTHTSEQPIAQQQTVEETKKILYFYQNLSLSVNYAFNYGTITADYVTIKFSL